MTRPNARSTAMPLPGHMQGGPGQPSDTALSCLEISNPGPDRLRGAIGCFFCTAPELKHVAEPTGSQVGSQLLCIEIRVTLVMPPGVSPAIGLRTDGLFKRFWGGEGGDFIYA